MYNHPIMHIAKKVEHGSVSIKYFGLVGAGIRDGDRKNI